MDETTPSTPTFGATAARARRAHLWVVSDHGPVPTADKVDCELPDDLCERISLSSSMEAQVDAGDLASHRDLVDADVEDDMQEVIPDEYWEARPDGDHLLFAFMGSGASADANGHGDGDDIIMDELRDLSLGDDIADGAADAAVAPRAGVDAPVNAAALNKTPQDRSDIEIDQGMRNYPTKRYDDLASYVADQQRDSGPPSEHNAPSLVLSARSTIEIDPPGTPRSKNGAGGGQPLGEELVFQLKELRYRPERGKPPGQEIEHRHSDWQSAGVRDYMASTAVIPYAHDQMPDQLDDMNKDIVSRAGHRNVSGGLIQSSSWDRDRPGSRERGLCLLECSRRSRLDVRQRELILDQLEAEFTQCHSGQCDSGNKSVAFDIVGPERTSCALGKRPQRDDDEEGEDNGLGKGPPGHRPSSKKSKQKDDRPCLACPFWKHNRLKHHACIRYVMHDIKSLKQHLDRQHKGPEYYCPICGKTCQSQAARDAHVRAAGCTEQEFIHEGIPADQAREICDITSDRKRTPERERWYGIFGILFPESPEPDSPYMEPGLLEPYHCIRQFIRHGGARTIISDSLRRAFENPASCEQDEEEWALDLFNRIFMESHNNMRLSQGIGLPQVGLADRPGPSSANSGYDTSITWQSQGAFSGRNTLLSTTMMTTVDEGGPSSGSHTIPVGPDEVLCFDTNIHEPNQDWGMAEMPFPPIDLTRYDGPRVPMNDGETRSDEFSDFADFLEESLRDPHNTDNTDENARHNA